jgi:hypothetical protein
METIWKRPHRGEGRNRTNVGRSPGSAARFEGYASFAEEKNLITGLAMIGTAVTTTPKEPPLCMGSGWSDAEVVGPKNTDH